VEFRDVLAQRRMHRAFLPDPLPRDQIERVAGVIRRAPSGGFSQGQSIVVVTEQETRHEIARRFREEEQVASMGIPPFVSSAPVHMIVSANEELYHARYNEPDKLERTGGEEVVWPVPYWFVDAGALMIMLQLAAIDEGLAFAFVGDPDQKRIFDEVLGLPPEVVPIGLALIGKPDVDTFSGERTSRVAARRRPLGDLVHWERW
jgi:FMN reductase [NAD(P)H]